MTGKASREATEFWEWFCTIEEELFFCETYDEGIYNELDSELKILSPDLEYEVSSVFGGQRELILTVDGKASLFPMVDAVVSASPSFQRWKITGLRPRRDDPLVKVSYEGINVHTKNVFFSLSRNIAAVDVIVTMNSYRPEKHNEYAWIVVLLIATALGERDYGQKVGKIGFGSDEDNLHLIAYKDFPKHFDEMYSVL